MADPYHRAIDGDLASLATGFGSLLREAGVPVTTEQIERFVRATWLAVPVSVDDLFWVARVTLTRGPEELDLFERVFNQVFRGFIDVADARGDLNADSIPRNGRAARPPSPRPPAGGEAREHAASQASPARVGDDDDGEEPTREVVVGIASREERLATTDFAHLTDEELRELRELMRRIRLSTPPRKARRHRRHRHGDRLDLRATLRRSRRTGGDPVDHVTRQRQVRPRRLVVLCDISGSMAPYSRACIQLLHAAAGGSHAEVFTFATRLTRLTRALAVAHPDAALARAAAAAPDWKGGTRIGEALKAFLDEYGRRGIARGAVVLVVSDGWDRGDPALLAEQMARLRRLAHRIVWVNPRRAAPGYEPLTGGMAAALPYCDALVGGHTLAGLATAVASIAE